MTKEKLNKDQWVVWTGDGGEYRVIAASAYSVVLYFARGWHFRVPRSQVSVLLPEGS